MFRSIILAALVGSATVLGSAASAEAGRVRVFAGPYRFGVRVPGARFVARPAYVRPLYARPVYVRPRYVAPRYVAPVYGYPAYGYPAYGGYGVSVGRSWGPGYGYSGGFGAWGY